MQRYGQIHQKYPQNGFFHHLRIPDFFQKQALSLLYPYGALISCKKLEKTNERSLTYLKKDHGWTHGQGRLLRTSSGEPGV